MESKTQLSEIAQAYQNLGPDEFNLILQQLPVDLILQAALFEQIKLTKKQKVDLIKKLKYPTVPIEPIEYSYLILQGSSLQSLIADQISDEYGPKRGMISSLISNINEYNEESETDLKPGYSKDYNNKLLFGFDGQIRSMNYLSSDEVGEIASTEAKERFGNPTEFTRNQLQEYRDFIYQRTQELSDVKKKYTDRETKEITEILEILKEKQIPLDGKTDLTDIIVFRADSDFFVEFLEPSLKNFSGPGYRFELGDFYGFSEQILIQDEKANILLLRYDQDTDLN